MLTHLPPRDSDDWLVLPIEVICAPLSATVSPHRTNNVGDKLNQRADISAVLSVRGRIKRRMRERARKGRR